MGIRRDGRQTLGLLAVLAVLLLSGGPPPAAATEMLLVVQLTNAETWTYPLSEVEELNFTASSLQVVRSGGTDSHALESIARIDFILDDSTGVEDPQSAADLIKVLHLFQNHPNPFNPETRIAFDLPVAGRALLRIYAVNGQLVRTLIDEEMKAGPHDVSWDGRNESGESMSSGVYFSMLAAPGVEESRKMILLR